MAVVECPMSGKVLEILVEEGQDVMVDDEVVIIEAMKMENPIYASESGKVKEIKVKAGQQVSSGQVLIVLE